MTSRHPPTATTIGPPAGRRHPATAPPTHRGATRGRRRAGPRPPRPGPRTPPRWEGLLASHGARLAAFAPATSTRAASGSDSPTGSRLAPAGSACAVMVDIETPVTGDVHLPVRPQSTSNSGRVLPPIGGFANLQRIRHIRHRSANAGPLLDARFRPVWADLADQWAGTRSATRCVTGSSGCSRRMRLGTSQCSHRDGPGGSVDRMIPVNAPGPSRRTTVLTA